MDSVSEAVNGLPNLKRARRRKPATAADALKMDRLPPHAPEMEKGVLGCILLSPNDCLPEALEKFRGEAVFYDLRHDTIFNAMLWLKKEGKAIDTITLQQHLKENGELDQCGGIPYLISLENSVPSAANVSYYTDIVYEKFQLRRLIQICSQTVSRVYEFQGSVTELLDEADADFRKLMPAEKEFGDSLGWDDLNNFDTDHDPNNVIGKRFLCRGHAAWLIGPSGIGKSALLFQFGVAFAIGVPLFGITPHEPRRVLIVQAENDSGDMSEMAKGIADGMEIERGSMDEKWELLKRNLRVRSITGKISQEFCVWLGKEIRAFRADLVLIDPLLSFAGIDVSNQAKVSEFCRVWLDPILRETGAVLISVHHTGKPPRKDGKPQPPQSLYDLAYSGIGSSELVNWARALFVLESAGDNLFRLSIAKRGRRAGARHPDTAEAAGAYTQTLWLSHDTDGRIYWNQVQPPAEAEHKSKGGAPSKVNQIIALGLGAVVDSITESKSEINIAKLVKAFAFKNGISIGLTKAKEVVSILVKNNALKEVEGGYIQS